MKLLSPAGNFEALKMAVYNGADEVYLGINDFNARNNTDGFTLESLKQAVDFAHIYGVKVYLAINILFKDSELSSALETLLTAYNMGVDAFIVQDLGFIEIISKNYPEIELHASTQMGVCNLEGVRAISKYGFKRIVLARETPLEEIKRIKDNCDIEIEYFVQGALCVCFSGNCYLSSYNFNASGNRGRCKQPCRLPYSLKLNGKTIKNGYLLSAKDFNMIERLNDLKKAGVDSLKIEGRARRPFYVATATAEYRKALDGISPDQTNLGLAFNRNYTQGYFNGNGKIISQIQNHIGISVGRVVKVERGKRFNRVVFTSDRTISAKSVVKLFANEIEISTISLFDLQEISKGKYSATTTQTVTEGASVRLILDYQKENETLGKVKKIPLDIRLWLNADCKAKALVSIGEEPIEIEGQLCLPAKSQPLSEQSIVECFSKNDYFVPRIKFEKIDNVFMTKSLLNDFRRKVYESVIVSITQRNYKNLSPIKVAVDYKPISFDDFIVIQTPRLTSDCKNAVYSPEEYKLEKVIEFVSQCNKKGVKPYLDTPVYATEKDVELYKSIIKETGVGVVANNYYATTLTSDFVVGAGLNVYNSLTAKEWQKPCLTAEAELGVKKVKAPYMTMLHCPIKSHVNGSCANCKWQDGYEYITSDGKVLRLKRKKAITCQFILTD